MSALETLEICFSANLSGVDAQLNGLIGQLGSLSAAATAAGRQGSTMAQLFASGLNSGAAPARSAGRALSDGFAAGIRSGSGPVNAAVRAIVSAATRKIRSLLSIHSPSKVAEGFGAYFGEGFALGIGGSVAQVERAAEALGGAATDSLSPLPDMGAAPSGGMDGRVNAAVERALGNVQLTIPLTVDGMKLGEASIRGINAVTRSAGRMLLEI